MSQLPRLVAETDRFCRECNLDGELEFDLNLVLEELFTNSVRHGGCEGMADAVRVRLSSGHDGVRVDYADRGKPYDPLSASEPDLAAPLAGRQAGGLGVHLVRQIMRDLVYRRAGEWNRITMRRPAGNTVPSKG